MALFRITKQAQAESDLDEIWFHIALDNIGAADALLDAIDKQGRLLATQPSSGRARPELADNLRSFAVGHYVIFYFAQADRIEIVRVLHGARDLGSEFMTNEFAANNLPTETAALKNDIDKGLADVAAGRVSEFNAEEIKERGRKLLTQRSLIT